MKANGKHLTMRIAELKDSIRRKYRQFKDGVVETEQLLEKQYQPLIKELKKSNFEVKQEKSSLDIKREKEEEGDDGEYSEAYEYDHEFSPQIESTPHASLSEIFSADEETVTQEINRQFENPLTREYMVALMKDPGGKAQTFDHIYGPRYNNSTLMVGDKTLEFDNDGAILIDKTRYSPTRGLYELLFKREPGDYTQQDLNAYKSIMLHSNAHKKGYKYNSQINRNGGIKYTLIISHLFPVRGRGMRFKSTGSRDIVYWDDPNELVDRLRLIIMSTESGNNSHSNEIINIIEELREGGYIRGSGNSRFKALLV